MRCRVEENYLLGQHTTFKIGGKAEYAFFPENFDEVIEACEFLKKENKKIIFLGSGSNVLISSKGLKGGVIFTGNINQLEVQDNKICAGAGVKLPYLSKHAAEKELSDAEFFVCIPGTVGGAVRMNASAHGQALEEIIESVNVVDLVSLEIKELKKEDLELSYRHSSIQNKDMAVLSACFRLKKSDEAFIKKKMAENLNYRKENHPPMNEYNCGSTFRNPEGASAGKLLEELDAKNWAVGGARVSSKHANFVINTGEASSRDILELMKKMYNAVKDNFGYSLKPEVEYLGGFDCEEEEIWNYINSK